MKVGSEILSKIYVCDILYVRASAASAVQDLKNIARHSRSWYEIFVHKNLLKVVTITVFDYK